MLLIKFYAGGRFFFPSKFKSSFEIRFTTFSQKKKKEKSKTKKQKINPSDCYKNWLLCSI